VNYPFTQEDDKAC